MNIETVFCPFCGKPLEYPAQLKGSLVQCKHCSSYFKWENTSEPSTPIAQKKELPKPANVVRDDKMDWNSSAGVSKSHSTTTGSNIRFAIVIAAAIIIVGVIYCATNYMGSRHNIETIDKTTYRIDRHTGEMSMVKPSGVITKAKEQQTIKSRSLFHTEMNELTGHGGPENYATKFSGTIYNGNESVVVTNGLDDYYGIRFGDNLDNEFEQVNAKLEHFWKIPVYPAFRLKSAHKHGDFQPRGVAVSDNGHKVIAVFARTKGNELDNMDAVADKLSSQYTQKFGSSPCVQRYGKRDKCFDRLLTWSFVNPATGLMGYLVIGIPSMQFVADTGSTRITMVLSTDFDVATHHQMISTWVLHDEKVMHDALVALAAGKVRVNSDEDNVNVDKYIKEAKAGNPDAAYIVACYYLKGNRDVPLALKWMKSAASQGHVKAQNAMGLFYSTGHGVPKNPKLSFEWYLKAAKQGDGDSQMSVGCCYEDGDGVEKNLKESYSWFLRGAKNNHPGCQWATATCLAKGTGVASDLNEAMAWLRKSANAGYASAEYDLAACYIQGVGVRKNFAEGEKWLKRAAEHGDEKAQKLVEDMKK